MRILLDARYLKSEYTGIGVYSEQLIEALGRHDHHNEYVVVVHSSYKGELELPDNFDVVEEHARPVSIRTLTTLATTYRHYGADVLHSLLPLAPLLWKGRLIATVFDLQPLLDPQFSARRTGIKRMGYDLFYRSAYPATLRKADLLLCVSYATKNDVIRMYPNFADKVLVVHAGVAAESFERATQEQVERVREKYDLPERYLFYIGSTRPNKNLSMMVDAFEEFLRRHPEQEDLHLVMVLKTDRFFDSLFAHIRERGLLRRIQIHEQVSEIEKRVFYQEAALLYFATKWEGFGFPVLEAQALGVPVLVSKHSSLPEVAGAGALMCDPDDKDSLADALEQFFSGGTQREDLIARGTANVRRFSWDHAAKEVLDMYEHLLS